MGFIAQALDDEDEQFSPDIHDAVTKDITPETTAVEFFERLHKMRDVYKGGITRPQDTTTKEREE